MQKDSFKEHTKEALRELEVTILALGVLIGFMRTDGKDFKHPLLSMEAFTGAIQFQYSLYVSACEVAEQEPKSLNKILSDQNEPFGISEELI